MNSFAVCPNLFTAWPFVHPHKKNSPVSMLKELPSVSLTSFLQSLQHTRVGFSLDCSVLFLLLAIEQF